MRQRLQGKTEPREVQSAPLIQVDADGSPRLHGELSGQRTLIEIPADINTLQRQHPRQAVQWRETTRRAFSEALCSGFLVEDFFRRPRGEQSVGVYVLSQGRTIEDLA